MLPHARHTSSHSSALPSYSSHASTLPPQALHVKRKTWAFWKNVRDGAMNYIADMHAKRRQLIAHFKARLLQTAYRAHLTRVRQRALSPAHASETAHDHAAEDAKGSSAFQQKRLPSKAMSIRKRKSVVPVSGASSTVVSAAAAASAPPVVASSQPTPDRFKSSNPSSPSLLPAVAESSPPSSSARRLSM